MEFTEFDMKVLFVSVLSLLLLSATAGVTPAAGGFGNPPQFNSSAQINLDVPEQPGTNTFSEGQLTLGPNVSTYKRTDKIIVGDNIDVEIGAASYNPPNNTDVTVTLSFINGSGIGVDSVTLNETENGFVETNQTGIEVTYESEMNNVATINWNMQYHPSFSEVGGSGGGLWSALQNIGSWIGYIAQLLAFAFEAVFSGIIFTFTIIVDAVTYMFGIIGWIVTGFSSIVNNVPAWAAPFVAMPIFLVGAELLKLILIAVNIIWIG